MSGKKCISTFFTPSQPHNSQQPLLVLKEKCPAVYHRFFDSGSEANTSRTSVKSPVYVAGFERGVLPIGS